MLWLLMGTDCWRLPHPQAGGLANGTGALVTPQSMGRVSDGRIGDSPVIGAGESQGVGTWKAAPCTMLLHVGLVSQDYPWPFIGTYACPEVAVSGTGYGEQFLRHVVAYDVAARMRYSRIVDYCFVNETLSLESSKP